MEEGLIGLMGGSFDPIHCSHIALAREAMDQACLHKVLFLVSGRPPHKQSLGASAQDRLAMARLALENEPWAEASDVELRPGTVYTVDTLRLLQERLPGRSFAYIIGGDTLLDLRNWRRFPEVAGLCSFLAAMRGGVQDGPVRQEAKRLAEEFGARIRLLPLSPAPLSSTQVRSRLRQGLSTEGLLPASVREYIDQHQLYGEE